ncbi:MAG: hypothetical protein V7K30_20330 [Nostoc sp.]
MDALTTGNNGSNAFLSGRQFVKSPSRQPVDNSKRELIDKLLLKRLSLAVIARITGVSLRWLQYCVNHKYYQIPKYVEVTKKTWSSNSPD